jgi:hypothetical protein
MSDEIIVVLVPCGSPAPLVVNGAAFVGCDLERGHPGHHHVEVVWG